MDSTTDQIDENELESEYLPGDEIVEICRVSIANSDDTESVPEPIDAPGDFRVSWRRYVWLYISLF